jgi:hypothetical protein
MEPEEVEIKNRELYQNLLKRGLPHEDARRCAENPELCNTPWFYERLAELNRPIISISPTNFARDKQADRLLRQKYRRKSGSAYLQH